MTRDAFEPGPNGDYPAFPRDAAGRPLWSASPLTDGIQVDGVTPMPTGIRYLVRRNTVGQRIRVAHDVTPRGEGGAPIIPPIIVPD